MLVHTFNNVSSAYSKRKVSISIFQYSSKRLSVVCKDGALWISKNVSKSFIKTAKRKGDNALLKSTNVQNSFVYGEWVINP